MQGRNESFEQMIAVAIADAVWDKIDIGEIDIKGILSEKSNEIIEKILGFIQDETLDDFVVVDEIINTFAVYGIDCGNRHWYTDV